jgi:hypothetical protein
MNLAWSGEDRLEALSFPPSGVMKVNEREQGHREPDIAGKVGSRTMSMPYVLGTTKRYQERLTWISEERLRQTGFLEGLLWAR